MTSEDYRKIAQAFATLADLFGKMALESSSPKYQVSQEYISKADAARYLGVTGGTITNRCKDGTFTVYANGKLKLSDVQAYAEGKLEPPQTQTDYRIESPRARAARGVKQ